MLKYSYSKYHKKGRVRGDILTGIITVSLADTVAVLGSFIPALNRFPGNLLMAQTIAFTTLVGSELLRAYSSRSEFNSFFMIGIFSNNWMVYATGFSAILMLLVIYLPVLQPLFGTQRLALIDWLIMLPFMLLAPVVAELTKLYLRRKKNSASQVIEEA